MQKDEVVWYLVQGAERQQVKILTVNSATEYQIYILTGDQAGCEISVPGSLLKPITENLTPYLAVRCVNKHIITLVVLDSETKFDETALVPIDVVCSECKTPQRFHGRQVFLWKGPRPSEQFQTHPAFR
jgi:hypothetical protein